MLRQVATWKKAVFGVLTVALVIAVVLFTNMKAENIDRSSYYDVYILGDWQINSIVGSGDVPEQYFDTSYLAQVTVNEDHTGVMMYGSQQIAFSWKYSEDYDDGSVGYTMNFDDGRLIGAIIAGNNSEDFPDYRGMLCVNIDDDTMMAFERRKSSTAETSAV